MMSCLQRMFSDKVGFWPGNDVNQNGPTLIRHTVDERKVNQIIEGHEALLGRSDQQAIGSIWEGRSRGPQDGFRHGLRM